MSDSAITAAGLGKRYRIGASQAAHGRLTESLWSAITSPLRRKSELRDTEEFWALRDVSFEVARGSAVGVIGRNGAGKSTLLKILSRITEPTLGRAELKGRVGSLLEVGTGFHNELTGRENIFLSGAILGMRRVEIIRRFDEIVEFADIGRFLDTPVKRYSSGMKVRLGFAVAAFLEPEILLIDEVLAVGDAAFQRKSIGRIESVTSEGRTVMFVSHDLGAVANLTQNCLYLEAGRIKQAGPTREIVRAYQLDGLQARDDPSRGLAYYRRSEVPDSPVRVVGLAAVSPKPGSPTIELGTALQIDIAIEVSRPIEALPIDATIKDARGRSVAVLYSPDRGFTLTAGPGTANIHVRIDDLPLAPGTYFLDVGLNQSPPHTVAFDVILDYPIVEVENTGQVVQWLERSWGALHPEHVDWRLSD